MKALRDLVLAIGAGVAVHRVLREKRRSERDARRQQRLRAAPRRRGASA